MIYPDYRVVIYFEEARRQDALREAEISRLLCRESIDRHPRGSLSRWARRALVHVGHLLVALGRRLECYGEPTGVLSSTRRARSRRPD